MTDKSAVIAEIIDAQRQLQRSFAEDRTNPLFHSALTMSQLKLLMILHHTGGCGGQELARAMGVSLATLTGIVDRLVAHDLVTRREDPQDRRVRRIALSVEGAQLTDGILTAGTQRLHQLLDRIDPDDLAVVQRGLRVLCGALQPTPADSGPQPADSGPQRADSGPQRGTGPQSATGEPLSDGARAGRGE